MKRIKVLMIVIAFILSFPIHFMDDLFPSFITSIFFPVNESIWEHMKIVYTSILVTSITEYFIYKKKNIKVNNFVINIPIISIIGIIIYLLLYLEIDKIIPHNLFISLTLLLIVFIICEVISYYILNLNKLRYEKIIGIVLIVLSYIIFTYFTYYPIKSYIFLDTVTNSYGIKRD